MEVYGNIISEFEYGEADTPDINKYTEVYISISANYVAKHIEDVFMNYHGMIYAAKDPKRSIESIRGNDDVQLILASMKVTHIGYMPILTGPHDRMVDTYVDNMTEPTIFMATHRDVMAIRCWVIER